MWLDALLQGLGIDYFWSNQQRIYLPFLLVSLGIGALFLLRQKTAYFTKSIWWHDSAKLDYKMFMLTALIKLSLITPLLFSVIEVAQATKWGLFVLFGYHTITPLAHSTIILLYSFVFFIANDLSRYGLHRFMHSNPWLWEIHQTHHSATVLTPITFYRVHPIELLLFGIRYMVVAGIITGVFSYLFGAGLSVYTIFGVHASVWLSQMLLSNLRHSHIHIGFGNTLEHWFISPAQHQIHHSQGQAQKNYGSVLAIWDKLFHSLKTSSHFNAYHFGLEQNNHNSIAKLFNTPFTSQKKYDEKTISS